MKYFLDFLAQLKKNDITPVYLFYGPENYLRDQAIRRLKEHLLPPGAEEFDYHVLDGGAVTGGDVVSAISYAPLVAKRRLVVVRGAVFFHGGRKEDEDLLIKYFGEPVSHACLVFDAGREVDRRRKVYKELCRVGRAIEFTRLKPPELVKWLAKLAAEEGCALQKEAAGELLARCGRNMYMLYNEMKKLTCYAGQGNVVGLGMVRELVAGRVEENIFEVVDAIGNKDCLRAVQGIRNLLLQKQQPQQITGMVARQFRLILQLREMVERGYSREEIIARLKMHPFVYKKIYQQRSNFKRSSLVGIINELNELDYAVKTGRVSFQPAMETLLLKICASNAQK